MITVREFDAGRDLATAQAWAKAHGAVFYPAILPPTGVIAERDGEPVAVCWLYLAAGVGVCWLDCALTAPGQSMRQAREALGHVAGALEAVGRALDYGLITSFVPPALARGMEPLGYSRHSQNLIMMTKLIQKEEHAWHS